MDFNYAYKKLINIIMKMKLKPQQDATTTY